VGSVVRGGQLLDGGSSGRDLPRRGAGIEDGVLESPSAIWPLGMARSRIMGDEALVKS